MIYDLHVFVLLILFVAIAGIITANYKMKKQNNRKVLVWRCLLALYLLLLIKITVFPFTFEQLLWMENVPYLAIQWKPFASIIAFIQQKNYIQIVGNIVLLMPLPLLLQGMRQRVFSKMQSFGIVCIASVSIEVLQLAINVITQVRNHVLDVDDLILNITGGVLLVLLYRPINVAVNAVVTLVSEGNRGEGR